MSVAHLNAIKDRMAVAAGKAGRNSADVTLVAVSKTQPEYLIRPLLDAGHRVFGENRVQESLTKWPLLKSGYAGVELHLIGPLQSNKVKAAVGLFDVIQTVDRPKIAEALATEVQVQGKPIRFMVQVNTGDESQKAGINMADADDFIASCRTRYGLDIGGVMCIPPATDSAPKHFRYLYDIAQRNQITQISMGMSSDYEVAILAGATHVRVGSALFGARAPVVQQGR